MYARWRVGNQCLAAPASRPVASVAQNLAHIEAALGELGPIVPVIVLDEAQLYSTSSLDKVRLLLGINLAEPSAFALALLGDEYLINSLRLRHPRALCSRVSGHCRLKAWRSEEVREYLRASLAAVGIEREAIEPTAGGRHHHHRPARAGSDRTPTGG